jgi:hypothetical protein
MKSINENFDKATQAMNTINDAQQKIWELHHAVRHVIEQLKDDKFNKLADDIWAQTLQIEHALLVLNEEIFAGESYWKNK